MKKTLINRISGLSFLIAIVALAISVTLMITGCTSAETGEAVAELVQEQENPLTTVPED